MTTALSCMQNISYIYCDQKFGLISKGRTQLKNSVNKISFQSNRCLYLI